jgi:response regulator RpfG family c-di-GMP phosphodiesterase
MMPTLSGEVPVISRPIVLCVDDDPLLLQAITRSLRTLDADVISTTKPQLALEMIGSKNIAVLVSDHEMPGMTGVELAAAARRLRPDTVRILLTGRQTFETALRGINECEVFRYINKPFDTKSLRFVVQEALDRHAELVTTSTMHARGSRRELISSALESEFPGLTRVQRSSDGAYIAQDPPAEALEELGLEMLPSIGRGDRT